MRVGRLIGVLSAAVVLHACTEGEPAKAQAAAKARAIHRPSADFDRTAARKLPTKALTLPVFRTNLKKMGWIRDDQAYLAAIPDEARRVPQGIVDGRLFFDSEADWAATMQDPTAVTKAKDVLTFRAFETSKDGRYVLRKIRRGTSGAYDQWYLLDVPRFTRAVISVHRETKRAYFFQIASFRGADAPKWEVRRAYMIGEEHCYSCHPTGLRHISARDDDPEVDRALLEQMNDEIEETGRFDFGGDVDFAAQGLHVEQCTDCHDGVDRGHLYPVHLQVARYKLTRQRAMPPDGPLALGDANAILDGMALARARIYDLDDTCPKAVRHMMAVKGQRLNPSSFAKTVQGCKESGTPQLTECVLDQRTDKGIGHCFAEFTMF